MRHKNGYRKLARESSHRDSMLRNLAGSLVRHERITTTLPKAKELRRIVEKLVTKGKTDSVVTRRNLAKTLYEKDMVKKLCSDISPRMRDRNGGYTRIIKKNIRFGDGATMAIIEFVDFELKATASA